MGGKGMKGRRIYSSATDSFAILPQRPSPKLDPQGPGKDREPRRLAGAIRVVRRSHRQLAHGADLVSLKAKQQVSRGVLFATLPDTQRRKRLSKRFLGIT